MSEEQFKQLLPLAVAWAEAQETRILLAGTPLTPQQIADARAVGVAQPERVRVLAVPIIPSPDHQSLQIAGELLQLISPFTLGLTVRHGIYVRKDFAHDRWLLAHELTHTGQFERLGGIHAFLARYLWECVTEGYSQSPLELEANAAAERLREQSGK